jgi:hypothetical protein
MKVALSDARTLRRLAEAQRGVFSKADLQTAFGDRHPLGFVRRVNSLLAAGDLERFTRGWYVVEGFDPVTLSQRIAPSSYVSFATVLARALMIGPSPRNRVMAAKVGRTRTYAALGIEIVHVGIAPHLNFGHALENGIRFANSEKAALDVLYFHLRGRRFPFDVYSDVAYDNLDAERLRSYLHRYRNEKFVAFARGVLGL